MREAENARMEKTREIQALDDSKILAKCEPHKKFFKIFVVRKNRSNIIVEHYIPSGFGFPQANETKQVKAPVNINNKISKDTFYHLDLIAKKQAWRFQQN